MTTNEIESFLKDIKKVCEAHNMSISHEDGQGGFLIDFFNDDDMCWLEAASDIRSRIE